MRFVFTVAALLGLFLHAGCPGSIMQPLPPGGGQGDYAGQFTDNADTTVFGSFEMTVDDVGAIEGSGQLLGRDVEIIGVLRGDEVDGFISDAITRLGGRFTGQRVGVGYIGEFYLTQEDGAPDLEGYWDASPAT